MTNGGHLVTISNELKRECERNGLSPKVLSEALIDFVEGGSKFSSSYFVPLKGNPDPCVLTNIIDIWLTDALVSRHLIMTITRNQDSGEIRFVYPELFSELAKSILSSNVKYDCSMITMAFPYMFVVFDTFNAFKKVYKDAIEGIVKMEGKSFMFSRNNMRSLIWEVDTPRVDYISNDLIPEKMRNLIKGEQS